MSQSDVAVCRGCKTPRPLSWFSPSPMYKNGLSQCRSCETERHRRYRERNRDRFNATARRRRQASADIRAKEAASAKAWREKNASRVRAYALSPKEKARKINLRAATLGAEGQITTDEWQDILASHGHACAYCGSTERLGHDHVQPISKGGLNCAENIVPCCQSCNSRKRDRGLIEFLMRPTEIRRVA